MKIPSDWLAIALLLAIFVPSLLGFVAIVEKELAKDQPLVQRCAADMVCLDLRG